MEALVALADALAWPITILVLAFALRKSFSPEVISELVRRTLSIKAGAVEVTFDKDLREAEKQAAAVATSTSPDKKLNSGLLTTDISELLARVAEHAPQVAILEAWMEVEKAILDVARSSGVVEPERRTRHKLLLDLVRRGIVSEEICEVYKRLREIRNKVVHRVDAEIDVLETERYIDLATDLAVRIKRGISR